MASLKFYNSTAILLSISIFCILIITTIGTSLNLKHSKEHKARQDWLNHGGDLQNRRYANKETKISPETAKKLRLKWEFYAGKDISATPAIYNGNIYFPSWNGYIYALKASDGSLIWKKNLQELTGLKSNSIIQVALNVNWTVSRSTPTVVKNQNLLLVGICGPAFIIAIELSSGEMIWSTKLENHPAAVVTMSGTSYKGGFYVGTSSQEESGTTVEDCCTFRGSFFKLDIKTGGILWQTYMLPENHGKLGSYAGAAVWGSSPSIDALRNHVYIATGNLYSVPQRISQCQENQNNNNNNNTNSSSSVPTQPDQCIEPDNHGNSILALDLESGEIKWYRHLGGYDVWFLACFLAKQPNCPPGPNLDADFGEAPMMLNVHLKNGTKRDIVIAVQKSGYAWALDRDNGNLFWSTEAGPGGIGGGGNWGAATDRKRVYTHISNSDAKNFTLKPSNITTTNSGWVAMEVGNGRIVWSTTDLNKNITVSGPVSVANGVLFGTSTLATGPIYAINAKTGEILWSYNTGATVYGGVSISNGCIYVGNGYRVSIGIAFPSFTSGTSLFAFCIS